ncbi:hypothetical protein V6N12_023881 [Hibiscus sabdariffa]|uniref:Uncharacterized protein n=1 Tax=Hibiscus sabdariffa TaxID=183260 RepID=A0ABR2FZW9_9ROSI
MQVLHGQGCRRWRCEGCQGELRGGWHRFLYRCLEIRKTPTARSLTRTSTRDLVVTDERGHMRTRFNNDD